MREREENQGKKAGNSYRRMTGKMMIYVLVGGVGGFLIGMYMAFGVNLIQDGTSFLLRVIQKGLLPLLAIILLASIFTQEVYSRKLKKILENMENAEDEKYAAYSYKEERCGAALTILNVISQVCNILVLSTGYSRNYIENASGRDLAKFLAACGIFILCFFLDAYYQIRFVKMVQKAHPEKKGEISSKDFQKQWLASCDEAEKEIVYQSAYKVYCVMTKSIAVLLGITMILHLMFQTGILAILVVAAIYLITVFTYATSCVSLQKKKLNR